MRIHRFRRCVRWSASRQLLLHTVLMTLWFCVDASLVSAQDRDAQITVRAYNMLRISPRELSDALRVAGRLLSSTNVGVRWRQCRIDGTRRAVADDPCAEPLRLDELIVRIVGSPRRLRDPDELGFSYVDADRRMGTLATVFADRVQSIASRAEAPSAMLLGSAIAHELGHLLLGTNDHSPDGLMRPHWTVQSRTLNQGPQWQFSVADALAVRAGAAARSEPTVVLAAQVLQPYRGNTVRSGNPAP